MAIDRRLIVALLVAIMENTFFRAGTEFIVFVAVCVSTHGAAVIPILRSLDEAAFTRHTHLASLSCTVDAQETSILIIARANDEVVAFAGTIDFD